MPLGLIAKDSIQDFTLMANEDNDKLAEVPHDFATSSEKQNDNDGAVKPEDEPKVPVDNDVLSTSSGDCSDACSTGSQANPQQAQKEIDEANQVMQKAASASPCESQVDIWKAQMRNFPNILWFQVIVNNFSINCITIMYIPTFVMDC